MKSRYQNGSIAKIPRAHGYAWRVRFSEWEGGKRKQKSITFDAAKYPNESDVRKAIQFTVVQQNRESERSKVEATFDVITELYRKGHLPELEHSTQQTSRYLLRNYIEPKFTRVPLRKVTPLAVADWFKELTLAPTTKSSIRSVMSQCFELAALHEYMPAFERNPMSLVRIKGTTRR